mmetsp:Transcript_46358/g.88490  ORF Transcript_46358/g.88490 Transcript_46358/m.88490 type:complete len:437 (+) Transcript_46358:1183-2493(+)
MGGAAVCVGPAHVLPQASRQVHVRQQGACALRSGVQRLRRRVRFPRGVAGPQGRAGAHRVPQRRHLQLPRRQQAPAVHDHQHLCGGGRLGHAGVPQPAQAVSTDVCLPRDDVRGGYPPRGAVQSEPRGDAPDAHPAAALPHALLLVVRGPGNQGGNGGWVLQARHRGDRHHESDQPGVPGGHCGGELHGGRVPLRRERCAARTGPPVEPAHPRGPRVVDPQRGLHRRHRRVRIPCVLRLVCARRRGGAGGVDVAGAAGAACGLRGVHLPPALDHHLAAPPARPPLAPPPRHALPRHRRHPLGEPEPGPVCEQALCARLQHCVHQRLQRQPHRPPRAQVHSPSGPRHAACGGPARRAMQRAHRRGERGVPCSEPGQLHPASGRVLREHHRGAQQLHAPALQQPLGTARSWAPAIYLRAHSGQGFGQWDKPSVHPGPA